LSLFFFSCSLVYAGPYLDSAHGNSSYGVKRSITKLSDYARGNCAHCHEMHASIGGLSQSLPLGVPHHFVYLQIILGFQKTGVAIFSYQNFPCKKALFVLKK